MGFYVKALHSEKVYLLSCYHVIWNGHDWDHFKSIGREQVTHPMGGTLIGNAYVALKSNKVDAVLIMPSDISIQTEIKGIGKVTRDRSLNPGDLNITVKMRGNTSGNTIGYISELNKSVYINYPDGTYKILEGLFAVKTKNGLPFSRPGDSGSLVVDEFGYAIGMIVAGDGSEISFAIPFSNLREQLNIEIFKA